MIHLDTSWCSVDPLELWMDTCINPSLGDNCQELTALRNEDLTHTTMEHHNLPNNSQGMRGIRNK